MINLFEERMFIDMWSVSHFLFGVLLYFYFFDKKMKMSHVLLFIISISIFWELFEIWVRVYEYLTNRLSDIFLHIIGYIIIFYIDKKLKISKNKKEWMGLRNNLIVIFILIGMLGWMSYAFL